MIPKLPNTDLLNLMDAYHSESVENAFAKLAKATMEFRVLYDNFKASEHRFDQAGMNYFSEWISESRINLERLRRFWHEAKTEQQEFENILESTGLIATLCSNEDKKEKNR